MENPLIKREVHSFSVARGLAVVGAIALLVFFIFQVFKAGTVEVNEEKISDKVSQGIFYYTVDNSLPGSSQFEIFRVVLDLEKEDIKTNSVRILGENVQVVTDSWKSDTVLFITNLPTQAQIYALDISNPDSSPELLLEIPWEEGAPRKIAQARFVDDGTSIAFVSFKEALARSEDSVLYIVSLADSREEAYPLGDVSPLYAGFGFLAESTHGLYLHETGGDAGFVWSQWYRVDRVSKSVQKLENLPPLSRLDDNPAHSEFSPNGGQIAYSGFSSTVSNLSLQTSGPLAGCLKDSGSLQNDGGVVLVRDLLSHEVREIFRNLSYPQNLCKNIARRILSLLWLSDSEVAVETIDGVFVVDIDTREHRPLFIFEKTFNPGQISRPTLVSIQMPFIIFSDQSVVHVNTRKHLEFTTGDDQKNYFIVNR